MKTKSQIIAEQESIGNVEISEEEYNRLTGDGEMRIWINNTYLNFAPRSVVHPEEKAAQNDFRAASEKKKDNQVVILDDNELSIMQYAKEFPDNWKKICKSLEKDNHSPQESKVGSATEGSAEFKDKEPENKSSNESLQTSFMGSGSDIPSEKVFDFLTTDIEELFDYIKDKGLSKDFADWKIKRKMGED
jgi:hypothetical protein